MLLQPGVNTALQLNNIENQCEGAILPCANRAQPSRDLKSVEMTLTVTSALSALFCASSAIVDPVFIAPKLQNSHLKAIFPVPKPIVPETPHFNPPVVPAPRPIVPKPVTPKPVDPNPIDHPSVPNAGKPVPRLPILPPQEGGVIIGDDDAASVFSLGSYKDHEQTLFESTFVRRAMTVVH